MENGKGKGPAGSRLTASGGCGGGPVRAMTKTTPLEGSVVPSARRNVPLSAAPLSAAGAGLAAGDELAAGAGTGGRAAARPGIGGSGGACAISRPGICTGFAGGGGSCSIGTHAVVRRSHARVASSRRLVANAVRRMAGPKSRERPCNLSKRTSSAHGQSRPATTRLGEENALGYPARTRARPARRSDRGRRRGQQQLRTASTPVGRPLAGRAASTARQPAPRRGLGRAAREHEHPEPLGHGDVRAGSCVLQGDHARLIDAVIARAATRCATSGACSPRSAPSQRRDRAKRNLHAPRRPYSPAAAGPGGGTDTEIRAPGLRVCRDRAAAPSARHSSHLVRRVAAWSRPHPGCGGRAAARRVVSAACQKFIRR